MRFYDPVPAIEKAVPLSRGVALSGGAHDSEIDVIWNGKQTKATVKGFIISSNDAISVVGIFGRFFAMKASGGYDSSCKKLLSSWSRKARYSAGIRKIMEKNPKKYKYELSLVSSYDATTKTATTPDGAVIPVYFGSDYAKVAAGEVGLISNRHRRHFVGGEALQPTGETFSFTRYWFAGESPSPSQFTLTKTGEITSTNIAELDTSTAIIGYRNVSTGATFLTTPSSGEYKLFGNGPLPFKYVWSAYAIPFGGRPAFSYFLPAGTYETVADGAPTSIRQPTSAYVVVSGKYYE